MDVQRRTIFLSDDQQLVVSEISQLPPGIYVLNGPAGSGKTETIAAAISAKSGLVLAGATTNRAAIILMSKLARRGIFMQPLTAHSIFTKPDEEIFEDDYGEEKSRLIFTPKLPSPGRLASIDKFVEEGNEGRGSLEDHLHELGVQPVEASQLSRAFSGQSVSELDPLLNAILAAKGGQVPTIIIDEASMVDEVMLAIIEAAAYDFGLRIILCGDQAQLPPVINDEDDDWNDPNIQWDRVPPAFKDGATWTLKEIHRHDRDSDLFRRASAIREKTPEIDLSDDDTWTIIGRKRLDQRAEAKLIQAADFIICWRRRTVAEMNQRKRSILGLTAAFPQIGEPVIASFHERPGDYQKVDLSRPVNNGHYEVKDRLGEIELCLSYRVSERIREIVDGKTRTRLDLKIQQTTVIDDLEFTATIDEVQSCLVALKDQHHDEVLASLESEFDPEHHNIAVSFFARQRYVLTSLDVGNEVETSCSFYLTKRADRITQNYLQYGYAGTCHKAQGGEFDNVLIYDDIPAAARFACNYRAWIYTALTRTKECCRQIKLGGARLQPDTKCRWPRRY